VLCCVVLCCAVRWSGVCAMDCLKIFVSILLHFRIMRGQSHQSQPTLQQHGGQSGGMMLLSEMYSTMGASGIAVVRSRLNSLLGRCCRVLFAHMSAWMLHAHIQVCCAVKGHKWKQSIHPFIQSFIYSFNQSINQLFIHSFIAGSVWGVFH
jgi:hypothetical protein